MKNLLSFNIFYFNIVFPLIFFLLLAQWNYYFLVNAPISFWWKYVLDEDFDKLVQENKY